jgi:hypothetical protein
MTDDPAEREYIDAKAAYDAALARLRSAKKARSKPAIRINSLAHKAQVREAIWQAYLAGERDYEALAQRFGRARSGISGVISAFRSERAFGPITAEEYRLRALIEEVAQQFR